MSRVEPTASSTRRPARRSRGSRQIERIKGGCAVPRHAFAARGEARGRGARSRPLPRPHRQRPRAAPPPQSCDRSGRGEAQRQRHRGHRARVTEERREERAAAPARSRLRPQAHRRGLRRAHARSARGFPARSEGPEAAGHRPRRRRHLEAAVEGHLRSEDSATSPAQSRGERSGAVARSERILKQLGYKHVKVDGLFDGATQKASRAFEKKYRGMGSDGKIDARQLRRMEQVLRAKRHPGSGPTLRQGKSGAAVRQLEKRLKAMGFDPGAVDGKFSVATTRAVRRFQRAFNLDADGIVGPKSWRMLGIKVKVASPGRRVTAYVNGQPRSNQGRVGRQRPVPARDAAHFKAMVAEARRAGFSLYANSGFRSMAQQRTLYWRFLNGTGAGRRFRATRTTRTASRWTSAASAGSARRPSTGWRATPGASASATPKAGRPTSRGTGSTCAERIGSSPPPPAPCASCEARAAAAPR